MTRCLPACIRLSFNTGRFPSQLFPSGGGSLCYTGAVYAQKFRVTVVIAGHPQLCPLDWLDAFCMRNFTNSAEFDDTLPTGDGSLEVSYRVKPERFAEAFAAWLTKRGKGNGQPVAVEIAVGSPSGITSPITNSG